MAGAARAAGVAIVGGDTKVVEHGKADRLYITTTGIGAAAARRVSLGRRRRCGPATRSFCPGPIGDHGITILLARGELDLEARPPLGHALGVPAGRGARRGGRVRPSAGCAIPTRGGVATSLNELALDSGLGIHLLRGGDPGARRGARRLRAAGARSAAHRQRGPVPRRRGAGARRTGRSRRSGATPGGGEAVIIGEVREEPPAAVLVATPVRREPDRRHARRRSAPADLLGRRACATPWTSRLRGRRSASLARNAAVEAFFAREAPRLAAACREMSERFLRGGRLLAFGRGPYATDAQHVSVEFVHPVIVGKRALPALDLSLAVRPLARRARPARRHGHGLRPARGRRRGPAARSSARRRGAR